MEVVAAFALSLFVLIPIVLLSSFHVVTPFISIVSPKGLVHCAFPWVLSPPLPPSDLNHLPFPVILVISVISVIECDEGRERMVFD